jgi:hypothetical protein
MNMQSYSDAWSLGGVEWVLSMIMPLQQNIAPCELRVEPKVWGVMLCC